MTCPHEQRDNQLPTLTIISHLLAPATCAIEADILVRVNLKDFWVVFVNLARPRTWFPSPLVDTHGTVIVDWNNVHARTRSVHRPNLRCTAPIFTDMNTHF